LALVAGACSDGDDGGDAVPAGTSVVQGEVVETPTGVLTEVSARRAARISVAGVVQVTADEPVQVEATATPDDGGAVVTVPRTALARSVHRLPVVGLRAETTYDIEVRAVADGEAVGQGTVELTTGALPAWMPELRVDASEPDRMAPGYTLFDIQRWGVEVPAGEPPGALVIVDEDGEVVWYHESDLGAGDARMTDEGTLFNLYAPFGFEEVDLLGQRIQAWVWGDEDSARPAGTTVVDSPTHDLVSFHHEVAPQPDGDILAFSRYQLDLTEQEQDAICPGDPANFGIREDLLMEFTREGEILHEWSLSDIVDPAEVPGRELCAVDFEDYRDWAHGNGAVLDEANNRVLVSARHIDLLFAFRYEDDAEGPSGELLWSIGPDGEGTLPLDGEPSYGLHAPELTADGSILVLDNGNDRPDTPEPYSRAVRYVVDDSSPDPADWAARQTWEFRTADLDGDGGPLYADFLGDADEQPNGNVLIGFGGIGQVEPPARGRIVEVVPTGARGGDIVFDLTLPNSWTSYRSERLPTLYTGPRWTTD
jgi:hypothetical protein